MQGLKKPEGNKFERFFEIVQTQAKKTGAVFFLFSGEGNELETDEMDLMDLSGWLIPEPKAKIFEKEWEQTVRQSDLEKWKSFFTFALWSGKTDSISIDFKDF